MEKFRREVLQQLLYLLLPLLIGIIIGDPFELSPVGGQKFRPVKNDIAPYREVMESWHGDNKSRLGLGNLEFVDEVFGPESLEFDILGRGPYGGLADGRIVRWMGDNAGWETFALVTPNWLALSFYSAAGPFLMILQSSDYLADPAIHFTMFLKNDRLNHESSMLDCMSISNEFLKVLIT